jgi:predicted nucleic acid-binding protein
MSATVFVDTNVLLYAVDLADKQKHKTARDWRDRLWESRRGRLSFQVLQEFYANVARKWPCSIEAARLEVLDLLAWQPIFVSDEILKSSWKIQDRFGVSFWDAMIVAAAKVAGCRYLLSEDFQTGIELSGVRIINPFRSDPDEILGAAV